jgi:hypothetical protein
MNGSAKSTFAGRRVLVAEDQLLTTAEALSVSPMARGCASPRLPH